MTALLELTGLVKSYGGVRAVNDISMTVEPGAITGLIGPNGSGKTSLLGMVAGTHAPTSGHVHLGGHELTGRPPHRMVQAGIVRTFQTTRVLDTWTVRDALVLAAASGRRSAMTPEEIATTIGLGDLLGARCADLPSAVQRLVMVATALATGPSVLLLDEPAVGMDVDEAEHLRDVVRAARDRLGVSVIVVEHNMRFLMSLADHVVVLASGALLAQGTPEDVRQDPAVITAYLGG